MTFTDLVLVGALAVAAAGENAHENAPWTLESDYARFRVIVGDAASDSERFAAEEFCAYWELTTGHGIAVAAAPSDGVNVWIGRDGVPEKLIHTLDLEGLGADGLCIKTVDDSNLLIVGGRERGTMYGVYEFFERYMGVRWLTPEVTHIPAPPRTLPKMDYRFVPVFEYRCSTYLTREDGVSRYQRVHRWLQGPGFGGHTFYRLVPPRQYYPEHPEYFSKVNGKRIVPSVKSVPEFYTQGPAYPEIWTQVGGAWSRENPEPAASRFEMFEEKAYTKLAARFPKNAVHVS
ncbi:MAG TPA: hypothetical protein HPP83_06025 [Candidatus Hydrogenedentes bacterium]|nr:hypothetical protein [Candidatus Hydrogenedentota bacterium]